MVLEGLKSYMEMWPINSQEQEVTINHWSAGTIEKDGVRRDAARGGEKKEEKVHSSHRVPVYWSAVGYLLTATGTWRAERNTRHVRHWGNPAFCSWVLDTHTMTPTGTYKCQSKGHSVTFISKTLTSFLQWCYIICSTNHHQFTLLINVGENWTNYESLQNEYFRLSMNGQPISDI